jgi:hypothetical protein
MSLRTFDFRSARCIVAAGCILLSACAATSTKESSAALGVLDHVDDVAAENGDRILVTRDYLDELKIDDQLVQRRYQYAWNYTQGVAQERTYDVQGQMLSLTDKPALSMSATEQERNYAFSLVRADPRWTAHLSPESTLYGGFIFREPAHAQCSAHSRCIHVFASSDGGQVTSLHVIVNLMTGQSFEPEPGSKHYPKLVKHRQQESKP